MPDWRASGLRYYPLARFLRARFGCRVWKVSLDAGFSCPNADGTLNSRGCMFCNIESFSPSRRMATPSLSEQWQRQVPHLQRRYKAERFIAYFQPATNTYAPLDVLRAKYEEALQLPGAIGLAIGTRPDCLPEDTLDLLEELNRRAWVSLELGLQTVHDHSLRRLNRQHTADDFFDAVRRSRDRGLHVGVHVLLGIPGESLGDMRQTANRLAECDVQSLKLHSLYAPRGTPLATAVQRGQVTLLTRDEYVTAVVDFLERTRPDVVAERLTAETSPEYLVAPQWCLDKHAVRRAIDAELAARDTWQGRLCRGGTSVNWCGTLRE